MKLHFSFFYDKTKKLFSYLAAFLERFLWGLDWFVTSSVTLLLILSITKILYVTKNRESWGIFMALLWILSALNIVLRLLEYILVRCSHSNDLKRVITKAKAKQRVRFYNNRMSGCLVAMAIICHLCASYYLGGDSRTFDGDSWWITAGQWPFMLTVILGFEKAILAFLYNFIIKSSEEDML